MFIHKNEISSIKKNLSTSWCYAMGMASHAQSTQVLKFETSLQYLKKKVRDDFCTDKHQSIQ